MIEAVDKNDKGLLGKQRLVWGLRSCHFRCLIRPQMIVRANYMIYCGKISHK